MALNGHPVEHDVERLGDRVSRLETRVENITIEYRHLCAAFDEVRADVRSLRNLAERFLGATGAIAVVWTVVTFIVAMLMRSR